MEIEGIGAVALVVVVFLSGLTGGFLWAGWSFSILLRRSGYRMDAHNAIQPIDRPTEDAGHV